VVSLAKFSRCCRYVISGMSLATSSFEEVHRGKIGNTSGGGWKSSDAKHPIEEWGFMADFADHEGNVLSLWEKPNK
jgi:predicted enzyme related to lactoylglutathione lyase